MQKQSGRFRSFVGLIAGRQSIKVIKRNSSLTRPGKMNSTEKRISVIPAGTASQRPFRLPMRLAPSWQNQVQVPSCLPALCVERHTVPHANVKRLSIPLKSGSEQRENPHSLPKCCVAAQDNAARNPGKAIRIRMTVTVIGLAPRRQRQSTSRKDTPALLHLLSKDVAGKSRQVTKAK